MREPFTFNYNAKEHVEFYLILKDYVLQINFYHTLITDFHAYTVVVNFVVFVMIDVYIINRAHFDGCDHHNDEDQIFTVFQVLQI